MIDGDNMALSNSYKEMKQNRIGETKCNIHGDLMRIVEYNTNKDIIVEFQDDYKARVHTRYKFFSDGTVRNPYGKNMYGVAIVGNKYSSHTKEYEVWNNILVRCFDEKYKEKYPTYQNVTCCEEWLLFENFYEWLHSQPNFEKWLNGKRWDVDKDIIIKGNKVYSPDNCCLVPNNVNKLFSKNDSCRGNLPIGVCIKNGLFYVSCSNPFTRKTEFLGYSNTPEQGFLIYKKKKESHIKQVAEKEYQMGNITKQCYEAMLNYEVEITD